jgi:uncharacterized protein (DUF2236 family)
MPRSRAADHGLFGPDSISWRVDREAALLLGGGRALLMQLAHPAVAQGVADHSHYRENPLSRLERTLDLSLTMVFGTRSQAAEAAARINRRHASVRGRGYSALDPDLLLWVHATLIESSIATYETFVGHLSRTQWETYYSEAKVVGRLLGIPEDRFPSRLDDFDAYVDRMLRDEVRAGELARELARHVLRPQLRLVPGPMFWPVETVTAGLLPPGLRRDYRLPWGRAERSLFALSRRVMPRLLAAMPTRVRYVPPARGAYRRLAA